MGQYGQAKPQVGFAQLAAQAVLPVLKARALGQQVVVGVVHVGLAEGALVGGGFFGPDVGHAQGFIQQQVEVVGRCPAHAGQGVLADFFWAVPVAPLAEMLPHLYGFNGTHGAEREVKTIVHVNGQSMSLQQRLQADGACEHKAPMAGLPPDAQHLEQLLRFGWVLFQQALKHDGKFIQQHQQRLVVQTLLQGVGLRQPTAGGGVTQVDVGTATTQYFRCLNAYAFDAPQPVCHFGCLLRHKDGDALGRELPIQLIQEIGCGLHGRHIHPLGKHAMFRSLIDQAHENGCFAQAACTGQFDVIVSEITPQVVQLLLTTPKIFARGWCAQFHADSLVGVGILIQK